jgi:hypothetical protein
LNTKKQKQHLKKFFKCQRGSITVLGLFVTVAILGAMAAIYKKMIKENNQTRERLQTYICFKHGLKKVKLSNNLIFHANTSISLINVTKVLNPGPHIETAKQLMQTAQYITYLSFIQNILFKKECHLWNKNLLIKKFPYRLTAYKTLARTPDGLAILKKKKDSLEITSYKHLLESFSLKADYSLYPFFSLKESSESPNFKITQVL